MDIASPGAPIFYSWPSQGALQGYPTDEANSEWAQRNFKTFLEDFTSRTDAEDIFLVAHSMGSRLLTGGFKDFIAERPSLRKRFREIILAAPDIDADVFRRDIAPHLPPAALYVSSADIATNASKRFHGYLRVGRVDLRTHRGLKQPASIDHMLSQLRGIEESERFLCATTDSRRQNP